MKNKLYILLFLAFLFSGTTLWAQQKATPKAGEGISCLGLHMTDFVNIFRGQEVPAQVFPHLGRSLLCQLVDDLVVFK